MAPSFNQQILEGSKVFLTHQEPWQELVEHSPQATPFQTWEWQSTWFKHFGRASKPLFWALYDGETLVGWMPMVVSRRTWSSLRAMGSGPSDILGPIAREGYEQAVAEEFSKWLQGRAVASVYDIHQIRENNPLSQKWTQPIEQANCLVLNLPKSWDDYLAMLGKSLRFDVRKLDKKPFATGEARIVTVTEENWEWGLEWLFTTHKLRWKERHLPGAFLGKQQAFHKEWLPLALKQGMIWLSIMEFDGKVVGAVYAMNLHKRVFFYQAGFDPTFKTLSPGTMLVAHTIRRAISENKEEFDFLRGDEGYKRRWQPQQELKNLRLLSARKPILGPIGSGWTSFAFTIEQRVRQRLEGKGL